ncbi:ABC transporter substrate-binding protein [Paraclostridium bifermentans]|nr:ABC transporter substrate-binding protein [Paraclostridium bifermentans]TQO57677.1 ABC transporter substrate-binding protein [Paraclostridium bifermentans]
MFKKISTLLAVATSLALGVTGCTKGASSDATDKDMTKLTVGEVTHSIFYAPQYAAITQGFFDEEGIEIDLINTQGADKTMAALLSGEVDIGLMGPEASIYVYNKGNDNYAVNFAQLTQKDGSFLVSREKNDNFSFDQLKGKEVLGGRKGGVPEMTLEYVLKKNNLTLGTNTKSGEVNVRTDVQFNVLSGSFAGGEGDYVALFEPAASEIEKQGKGYVVASIGEESGLIPYTAYSAPKDYIKDNKEVIQRFTNAVYKGQIWVKNHTAEEVATAIEPFFTDFEKKDLVSVVERYKSIDAWSSDPVLKEDSLNLLMNVMKEANELDKKAPYEKIVDTSFANESIKNIK